MVRICWNIYFYQCYVEQVLISNPLSNLYILLRVSLYFLIYMYNTLSEALAKFNGGEGGIRTLEPLAGLPVFETSALDRYATSPCSVYCVIGKISTDFRSRDSVFIIMEKRDIIQ